VARDYAGEYARRNARAQERGFKGYTAERVYKVYNEEELNAVKESSLYALYHEGQRADQADPRQLRAFYYAIEQYEGTNEPTGKLRHDAVSYFTEYEGMTEEEAIAAMRLIYGDTGEG